jgi:hypothetical protein
MKGKGRERFIQDNLISKINFVWARLTVCVCNIFKVLIAQPARIGRFKHPLIIDGVKSIYFRTKKSFGFLSPCDDITALCEVLTAEAIAWICITVHSFHS